MKKSLVWLRNDLRVSDNPALYQASLRGRGVTVVYILCEEFLVRHETAPARLDFIRRHLSLLRDHLQALNIPMRFVRVRKSSGIPSCLLALCRREHCDQLFFNAEYPLDEWRRDRSVAGEFKREGIRFVRFHDRVLLPPGSVRNQKNQPYQVFSAYKKRWLQKVMPLSLQPHGFPQKQPSAQNDPPERHLETDLERLFDNFTLRNLSALWPAGEEHAHQRLIHFLDKGLDEYHRWRDFPAEKGTSELSPYLAVGSISPRQCLSAALSRTQGHWSGENPGAEAWMSEFIWRDFYQHLVVDFPQVCRRKAMQPRTEAFPWRYDQASFTLWCRGLTGVPIVDAAMRQLRETGWMHNRLRMVVAMFLTKNLRIDWRWGESWFMSQLIDGDFAANNGGWQWSASTGTDAAPYFRVFNPISQSRRYDPQGSFIRRYLPELSHLSDKAIHEPPPTPGYPESVVDLKASRKHTIKLFETLIKGQN